ncbi:MAG: glycosyltransferase [Mucilaginibacter sp.]|nr:glycosyltransferase [Mucilaginibacter sp.]
MKHNAKKILFITSGQPSLNPRLVKEADALADAGYTVTVLYMYWNKWGVAFDKELIATKKWTAICIGGEPQHTANQYLASRIIFKVARLVSRKTKGRFMADIAAARASYYLIREAKKHTADLYIGHNLGALPAVVRAAKANNRPCGFDAEDFHRYENSNDDNNDEVILKISIENKYIPQLNYFTTSSLQIAEAYSKIFEDLKPVVLLNVFPKSNFTVIDNDGPLRLFWFSQTIGPNRGLDDIISALQILNKADFELHLLGDISTSSKDFIDELKNSGVNIKFHAPIPPDEIIPFANQFDIGLALENKVPVNRDICLTNKIFTYMQAGLAIIASDTTAQRYFIAKNPTIGQIYTGKDSQAVAVIISNYYKKPALLTAAKNEALRLGHEKYNWEVESVKFLKLVEETLSTSNS